MTNETTRVDELTRAWDQFRAVNDMRMEEIERKGSADVLYTDQLVRLNEVIDAQKQRIDRMETALARPGSGAAAPAYRGEAVSEHKAAFTDYLRKGVEGELARFEQKALSVGSDPDGGYLVSPTMSDRILTIVRETSPLRDLATVETITSDALEMLEDRDEFGAGWTAETASVSETATPQIGKRVIPVHELYAQPKATQKLLDDSAINIEEWLATKVADIFSRKENNAFVSGSGVGQPRGILTYAAGTSWGQVEQVNSGTSAAVTADGLFKLFYALKDQYARGATWLMHRSTVQAVRLLKEATTGQYLWQPGLAAGAPDTLLGVPVVQAVDMPIAAANSLSVAVGDFRRAYTIVDRIGLRVLRDPFTDKPFVKFYSTKRVGGDVANFEAIKLLKLA